MGIQDKEKPIGVFDSGIGGLTVVKKISQTFPNENIIYFGDTARVPYGSKSNSTVIEYSIQDARFLMSKGVKIIVAACNTASSVALNGVKKEFNLPVIGMIEPGAKSAAEKTTSGKIGVIGTRATINNKAYSKEIKKINPALEVYEKACPLFVPLAEEGWIKHPAAYQIAEEYLKELRERKIDTLVLGCTHYPILSEVIQEIIGRDVALIDSGVASAEAVNKELKEGGLFADRNIPGVQEFYVSDIPIKFKEVAELFFGRKIKEVKKIELEELTEASNS
ncbi:MAG TPA: glutamate racemase [Ignavibacteriaceae bacterium]|nr:glutamate racemase [Ignavibacteriaceae bacterium]